MPVTNAHGYTEVAVVSSWQREWKRRSDQQIHRRTMKYIADDYKKNRDHYADADRIRIRELLGVKLQ